MTIIKKGENVFEFRSDLYNFAKAYVAPICERLSESAEAIADDDAIRVLLRKLREKEALADEEAEKVFMGEETANKTLASFYRKDANGLRDALYLLLVADDTRVY